MYMDNWGGPFDLNGDGELDMIEQALEFQFLEELFSEDTSEEEE